MTLKAIYSELRFNIERSIVVHHYIHTTYNSYNSKNINYLQRN